MLRASPLRVVAYRPTAGRVVRGANVSRHLLPVRRSRYAGACGDRYSTNGNGVVARAAGAGDTRRLPPVTYRWSSSSRSERIEAFVARTGVSIRGPLRGSLLDQRMRHRVGTPFVATAREHSGSDATNGGASNTAGRVVRGANVSRPSLPVRGSRYAGACGDRYSTNGDGAVARAAGSGDATKLVPRD